MKPGWKTTEFWLSFAAMIVGAVMASGLLEQSASSVDNQIVGMVAVVLGALGYAVPRTFAKSKAEAAPVEAPKP